METQPLLSIITVNYRQAQVTNQLLVSLGNMPWRNYEVIIVDNSENGDADNITLTDPRVQLIVSPRNEGFAAGNNIGLREAKGDYLLLLNNDTEVAPDFIEPLVNYLAEHHEAGAVCPKIKYYYAPQMIQYAGFSSMNPFTLRMRAWGSHEQDSAEYGSVRETDFAHGCAMMIPRKVYDRVGTMPEEYFLYYEEHEWSARIRRSGYRIFCVPQSVIWHKESVSVDKLSPMKTYYISRNRILFMRRNLPFAFQLVATLYLALISVPSTILRMLFTGQFSHLQAYTEAILWHLTFKTSSKWNH